MVISSLENLQGQVLNHINLGQYIASKVPSLKVFKNEESKNGEGNSTLKNICDVFLLLQRYEFKMNQEEWVNTVKPVLGDGISGRVHAALETTDEQIEYCLKARNEMHVTLSNLLKDD